MSTPAASSATGRADAEPARVFDDTVVLVPAAGVLEVPVGDEVILWKHDRIVPLHLNPVATTIWWHVESAPLGEVIRDVADFYGQPLERVTSGVQFVTRSLQRAGLLQTAAEQAATTEPPSAEPVLAGAGVIEHERCAQISPSAAEWLERRAAHRVAVRIDRVRFGIASNTADLDRMVSSRLTAHLDRTGGAAIRYHLIDAGPTGLGTRYWLLSDSGLPLERTDSPDDLVERLLVHIAEVGAVQRTAAQPLRLGVLEAHDHAVAVQWDLLSSRPTLEPALHRLGYRIRSGQWAIVDRSEHSVLPGAVFDDDASARLTSGPSPTSLPLRAIVAWCGPGSLDVPSTHAEWVWTLVMLGCSNPDSGHFDRRALLDTAVTLTASVPVVALAEAGPSALLDLLADISRRPRHG